MKLLKLVQEDPWLTPFKDVVKHRTNRTKDKWNELMHNRHKSLSDFANGHLTFGCFKAKGSLVFREWLPNAIRVYLIGGFSDWTTNDNFLFTNIGNGNWELVLNDSQIEHGDLYKLKVIWGEGEGERIPAWSRRVVQDENTKMFCAQVWCPKKQYEWKYKKRLPSVAPIIYEAHIGMSGEDEKVSTFLEFKNDVLPRISKLGYNTLQLMAVQEHPYYGSFGYHVSSFFAVSSRFGTPEELKVLIDAAHAMGIRVIMDLVHSHAVKNELEGLGKYDGTQYQFFHDGSRGEHPAWDSYCFDYKKNQVIHFLLSNIKYWLDEFKFDGFRFDGVTSMLYYDHGLGRDFTSYDYYFDGGQDEDAITYLMLANLLIKEINPEAISIAEEMSGYPGIVSLYTDGGVGFDYRLAMGIPDFWIKTLKENRDEDWPMGKIYHELTSKRAEEKTISYAESHDQALVGDKTLAFQLMDKDMYFHMHVNDSKIEIDRGLAIHKMIRLITLATAGGGYLNFMGNEFGHPDWIDFPREGNDWSYKHATRQWSLVDRTDLKYKYLNNFEKRMIAMVKENNLLEIFPLHVQQINEPDNVIAFSRADLIFVFNFHPSQSYTDYGIPVSEGKYKYLFSTDELDFGGFGLYDETQVCNACMLTQGEANWDIKLYLPARTAIVLQKLPIPKVYQRLKNIKK
jgi:1,4-alpha-glucan branching enzyme